MGKGTTTPTRVTADVAATAASVAPGEHRTVTEQINYWARLGMQIERSMSATSRGVLAAVTGEAQFASLAPDDRAIAHATVDARIAERVLSKERFGAAARKAGQVTVSIDDDGTLVEIAPDGSRRPL